MSEVQISINDLECRYDDNYKVLFVEEMQLRKHKLTFILGSSGVGKTSFLQAIGLMKNNFNGEINLHQDKNEAISFNDCWNGESDINEIRRKYFSFMFQETHFFNSFSIDDSLKLPQLLTMNNSIPKENHFTPDQLMKSLNLGQFIGKKDTKVERLSVGQKQRISFIQAIIKEGSILFADEPTGNLDWANSCELMNILRKIIEERILSSSIIVSHDFQLAADKADDIILMSMHSDGYGQYEKIYTDVQRYDDSERQNMISEIQMVLERDLELLKKS